MSESLETYSDGDLNGEAHDPRPLQRGRAYQIWSYSDTGHELTVEEQLFCRSYIIDRNEVAAMRRLGYDMDAGVLRRRAQKMLLNPEVQGCIEALAKRMMDNLQITAERVNEGMAAIAFADLGEIMEFDHTGVRFIHSKYWTKEQRMALAGVKMTKDGVEVKFHDRSKALEFLGKQLNLVDDEKEMARAAAEGAARGAMDKILEITQRMKGQNALPTPANEEPRAVGR